MPDLARLVSLKPPGKTLVSQAAAPPRAKVVFVICQAQAEAEEAGEAQQATALGLLLRTAKQSNPAMLRFCSMPRIKVVSPIEEQALSLFKQAWIARGYSVAIPLASEAMPRERYALAVASALVAYASATNASPLEAAEEVLSTTVGNASQLLGVLVKDGFLKRESASEASNSLLARAKARAEAQAAAKAASATPQG